MEDKEIECMINRNGTSYAFAKLAPLVSQAPCYFSKNCIENGIEIDYVCKIYYLCKNSNLI